MIKHVISFLIFPAATIISQIYDIPFLAFAIKFVSWLIFLVLIMMLFTFVEGRRQKNPVAEKLYQKLLDGYRNGKHLPCLADQFFYSVNIICFAYYGHTITTVLWVGIAIIDLKFRYKACENSE